MANTPTLEEIREACWGIQSGCTEAERLPRIVDDFDRRLASRWIVPGAECETTLTERNENVVRARKRRHAGLKVTRVVALETNYALPLVDLNLVCCENHAHINSSGSQE